MEPVVSAQDKKKTALFALKIYMTCFEPMYFIT